MQSKRIKEGEVEQGNFEDFSRWCERTATEKQYTIADEKEQISTLDATIDTATSNIEQLDAEIEKLSSSLSSNEEQLKEATAVRNKEHKDFVHRDKDLASTIDMLQRAGRVLEKHLNNPNAAALLQTALQKVMPSLQSLVDASFVNLESKQVLMALIQQQESQAQGEDDSDSDLDVSLQPQGSTKAYESKSGGILKTIANMREKAEETRSQEQRQEMKTQFAYEMLAQSMNDDIDSLKRQLDDAKKTKNKNSEVKATAEGSLEGVTKDLAADQKALSDLQQECMSKADEFSASQSERAAELKVLAEAKKILANAGKAADFVQTNVQSDDSDDALIGLAPGFLQTKMTTQARMQTEWQSQAASYLMQEGNRIGSWVLSQVGSHLQAGGDPFGKVKGMIQQMIEKLLEEQAAEAEHKGWCDVELAKTKKALKSRTEKLEDLSTRIEKADSMSNKLSEQIELLA